MGMTFTTTNPVIIIHEPQSQLRAVYIRHVERQHVPVLGVGTHEQFVEAVTTHKPAVALFSTPYNSDRLWQTMLAATTRHPSLHIVLLTDAGTVSATETLGSNIAAHISKQHSSPKEVIRTLLNFLTHTNAHV